MTRRAVASPSTSSRSCGVRYFPNRLEELPQRVSRLFDARLADAMLGFALRTLATRAASTLHGQCAPQSIPDASTPTGC